MKLSLSNTIIAIMFGAAMLGGCASDSQNASTAAPKNLPKNPAIEAYVATMRADLSDGKIQIIGNVMKLTNDEAKVFWPIYQDYETELFELGDQRVDLIRRFAASQKSGVLEQRDATALADGYFKFEQERLGLVKKYHGIIATELSPIRAAQFTQIEHRVGTIIDLAIAADMPLIRVAPVTASR